MLNNIDQVKGWIADLKYYLSPVVYGLMLAYILRPFARFMERVLLKNNEEYKRMCEYSTALFEENFLDKTVAKEFEAFYKQLVDGRK